jgi:hypothetical protein
VRALLILFDAKKSLLKADIEQISFEHQPTRADESILGFFNMKTISL